MFTALNSTEATPDAVSVDSRTDNSTRLSGSKVDFSVGSVADGRGKLFLQPKSPAVTSDSGLFRDDAGFSIDQSEQSDDDAARAIDSRTADVQLVYVHQKVNSLLNSLTMEKLESISQQILDWANRSVNESDGHTMFQVIILVFGKAIGDAARSEMYARLCRFLMERISQDVRDEGIKSTDGKPIAGSYLFRKYLLNRCQEDFEAMQAAAGNNKAAAAERAEPGEEVIYSDKYYASQRAKRRGRGLVKFIGELFKLQMLTERIMHECIEKLLSNVESPEEEEIDSLCTLLATVGQALDTIKARTQMDMYFSRMQELAKSGQISSRIQYILIVRTLFPFLCLVNCAIGYY